MEIWPDERVVRLTEKFIAVSIDERTAEYVFNGNLAFGSNRKYNVRVLPTIVILDPWQEMVLLSEGYILANELAKILNEIPGDYSDVRKYHDAFAGDRGNSRALANFASVYDKSTAFGIANRYYREALKAAGAKEDPALREDLQFRIAMNEIRRADWNTARRELNQFSSDFPQSASIDQALLGLLLVEVRQKKVEAAQQRFEELKTRFPGSEATVSARQLMAQLKTKP